MKITGIYKIQSKCKPQRVYIGSAVDINSRWNQHYCDLRKNKHNKILQNHYNKYGEFDLQFSIIEQFKFISKDHLLFREQFYINLCNPYFNVCKIAGSCLGYKHSKETRKKESIARKGNKCGFKVGHIPWCKNKKMSKEFKENCRKRKTGTHHSKETCKKQSKALIGINIWMKGRIVSLKTREKRSKSITEWWRLKKLNKIV